MILPGAAPARWRTATRLATLLFFLALGLALSGPVSDPDSWWHLATGRWMAEHRSLARADPFGVPLPVPADPSRTAFALRQYWLAQLVSYGVYALGGFRGLILLRALLLTGMFAGQYLLLRRVGAGRAVAVLLVAWAAAIIAGEFGYTGDRPQLWSSLLGMAVLLVLDALRLRRRWAAWALPLLLLLWSNLHGGYVLGMAVVLAAVLAAIVTRRGDRRFYAAAALALLAAGANPCGFTAVVVVARTLLDPRTAAHWGAFVESQSIFRHGSLAGIARRLPFFAALAIASVVSFVPPLLRRRPPRVDLLFTCLIGAAMGAASIRYLVFAVPVAGIALASNLRTATVPAWRFLRRAVRRPLVRSALRLTAIALVLLPAGLALRVGIRQTALGSAPPHEQRIDGAVAYIRSRGLTGNLFNEFADGGRLIWELAPAVRVYIDGRSVSMEAFDRSRATLEAPFVVGPGGRPRYREVLDADRVDLVLVPGAVRFTGTILPLATALLRDPEWALVYADAAELLFLRSTPANAGIIAADRLPAAAGWENLLALAREASGNPHGVKRPDWILTTAIALDGRGEPGAALAWLERYLALVPGDPQATLFRLALLMKITPAAPVSR